MSPPARLIGVGAKGGMEAAGDAATSPGKGPGKGHSSTIWQACQRFVWLVVSGQTNHPVFGVLRMGARGWACVQMRGAPLPLGEAGARERTLR
jgi:hypothetical protein